MKFKLIIPIIIYPFILFSQDSIPNGLIQGQGKSKAEMLFYYDSDIPFTGFGLQYYPDNVNIRFVTEYRNGLMIIKTGYYPTGELLSYTEFGNNQYKITGKAIYYYKNGSRREKSELNSVPKNPNMVCEYEIYTEPPYDIYLFGKDSLLIKSYSDFYEIKLDLVTITKNRIKCIDETNCIKWNQTALKLAEMETGCYFDEESHTLEKHFK